MFKAICYKEWIKTRWFVWTALVASAAMVIYTLMRVARVAKFQGVGHLWEILITREVVFVEVMRYVPLLLAVVLALTQFVPEVLNKRLKLTLHLPFPGRRMILLMTGYGMALLVGLFGLQYVSMAGYLSGILAPELVSRILLTALPWYVCGMCAYLMTAWVCLEPSWRRRIVNVLIAAGVTSIFFLSAVPEAFNGFLPVLVIFMVCAVLLPLLSVQRFKEGVQD